MSRLIENCSFEKLFVTSLSECYIHFFLGKMVLCPFDQLMKNSELKLVFGDNHLSIHYGKCFNEFIGLLWHFIVNIILLQKEIDENLELENSYDKNILLRLKVSYPAEPVLVIFTQRNGSFYEILKCASSNDCEEFLRILQRGYLSGLSSDPKIRMYIKTFTFELGKKHKTVASFISDIMATKDLSEERREKILENTFNICGKFLDFKLFGEILYENAENIITYGRMCILSNQFELDLAKDKEAASADQGIFFYFHLVFFLTLIFLQQPRAAKVAPHKVKV